jgi:lysophospholipase L1-like esterase
VLLLGEVAARILRPEWQPTLEERVKFWRYDERLGWAHRPGQRGVFSHSDFSVEIEINSDGLRDDEYAAAGTGKKRMLVLGDSFGWGFGVEHEERFSEILEAAHPGWEIINASVSGYGTDQQYLYLEDRGLSYGPDVVLVLFYEDDFTTNRSPREHWYNKPYFVVGDSGPELRNVPVPKATVRQAVGRFALGRTYLGRGIYGLIGHRLARPAPSPRRPAAADPAGGSGHADPHRVTRGLIHAMDELAESRGARLIVASVPMSEADRAALRGICEAQGIPYLPLDPFFEGAGPAIHFPNDKHWNAAGHAVAARAIDGFLKSLGVLSGGVDA